MGVRLRKPRYTSRMSENLKKRGAQVWAGTALALGICLVACKMDSSKSDSNIPATDAISEAAHAKQELIGGVQWYVDYEVAVEIARKQDKSLWVHFGENPG